MFKCLALISALMTSVSYNLILAIFRTFELEMIISELKRVTFLSLWLGDICKKLL